MPKKIGRPKLPKREALGELFGVRLRPGEATQIRDAIRKSGKRQPDWLRSALLSAARSDGER
jgi:hypothetical protein